METTTVFYPTLPHDRSRRNVFPNRRSDCLPERTYLEWEQDQTSLLQVSGQCSSDLCFVYNLGANLARDSYLMSHQHGIQEFYAPSKDTVPNGARLSQLSSKSARAPELYVAETTLQNLPQLHEDAELESELLNRYDCNGGDVFKPGDHGILATSKQTGTKVFIKRTLKGPSQADISIRREIQLLNSVSDPAVLPLVEWVEFEHSIWTVTEHRAYKTIRELIREQGPFPEDVMKTALNQLFSGIANVLAAGFAHLRICDETVCLDDEQQLIIKDFQYVCEYGKEKIGELYAPTQDKYGDDIYVAPEVFANRTYNARKAVMWSCGVLIYFMTTGQTEKLSNLAHPSFETTTIPEEEAEEEGTGDGQTSLPNATKQSTSHKRNPSTTTNTTNRKLSLSHAQSKIILYPNRFTTPNYARAIIPKMLIHDPRRRAELIEVASRVPKDFSAKCTRPLMELAWLDYKTHVGPNAGLHLGGDDGDRGSIFGRSSSVFSAASRLSNPFAGLLGGNSNKTAATTTGTGEYGHSRRKSAPVDSRRRFMGW